MDLAGSVALVTGASSGLGRQFALTSERLPRRRIGQPAQLDSTLLYLVDPASECVTGTIVKVDDGQMPR